MTKRITITAIVDKSNTSEFLSDIGYSNPGLMPMTTAEVLENITRDHRANNLMTAMYSLSHRTKNESDDVFSDVVEEYWVSGDYCDDMDGVGGAISSALGFEAAEAFTSIKSDFDATVGDGVFVDECEFISGGSTGDDKEYFIFRLGLSDEKE